MFFAHFFRLLVFVISIAQWATFAWLLSQAGKRLPLGVHLAGPLVIHAANRMLIGRMRQPRTRWTWSRLALRGYAAVAFTSLFCAAFLLASAISWATMHVLLGALTVEAGTLQPSAAASTIDGLFHWISLSGVATITVAFAYGYTLGQHRLTVTPLKLSLGFPEELDGLRIAHISDIHIGHNLSAAQLDRFVRRVNELEPDLICITGDIVDGPATDMAADLPRLAALRARYGVFAILGNHDHYAGADRVEAALHRHTHFTVLRDAAATIAVRGVRLHIAGVDDRGRDWCRGLHRHPGLSALTTRVSLDEPIVLLSHRPEPFTHATACGIRLTLAGHTHGGQVAMPWFDGRPRGLAWFVTPFERGLYEQDGCYLYVNRGLGVTGPLMRLCAPREISLIEVAGGVAAQITAAG